ncbi:DUF4400 domain-containing protein [Burkholderia gladioli]|uniref:DUF4400 domain-containing protein n=1 Tax=Burkholderia gladioli TaxID=28095 RepID=UPI001FC8E179|nr:DUF4400 domain-containing protein [Burkholderia gladioli]
MQASMESTGSSQIEDGGVADFANRWGHNFWRLVYRMAYRLIVMKYWVLGVLVFGIAMFVDGAVRRKVTAAAAGFVSSLWFQLAAHGILPVFGTTFTFLIASVLIIAPYLLVVAACLGLLLWKVASSYQ